MNTPMPGSLVLEDGAVFRGTCFGAQGRASGEVVFTTGMVGYHESLTDPSYCGQILVFTYPSVGNYGVPDGVPDELGLRTMLESARIHARGVIVTDKADDTSHHDAAKSFTEWLVESNVPGLTGVDTRELTQHLRDKGCMRGSIVAEGQEPDFAPEPGFNPVAEVAYPEVRDYGTEGPRIILLDTGVKESIVRHLVQAGTRVRRVPWDYDFFAEEFDGLFLGNGPGDPKDAGPSVELVKRALRDRVPTFGLCLGNQLLALAAGAETYKLKFGHRGHNLPCLEVGTERCYITSQNHGYAVAGDSLPDGWREWFVNANDQSNEGIRHEYLPARGVQFHPEAAPGPVDTEYLFRRFVEMVA